jgi:tripartite-type tricarboxylate transporter receptor subunit TctC
VRLSEVLLAAGIAAASLQAARADADYPCRGTVKIIVPFPAGTITDAQIRIATSNLAQTLGRNVIVENAPGAYGVTAAERAARADPDGCTILALTNAVFGIEPMNGIRLPFDPLKFSPITKLARSTQLMVVSPDNPAKTIREFIEWTGTRDATYGAGNTSGRVTGALFTKIGNARMRRISYSGEPQVIVDLLAKRVDTSFLLAALPQVQSGGLRALAVMSNEQFSGLPGVPAIAELYPEFKDIAFVAPHSTVVGPPGLSREVAERLSRDICAALKRPDVVARFEKIGSKPACSTPSEHGLYLSQQSKEWPRIVQEYDLHVSEKN